MSEAIAEEIKRKIEKIPFKRAGKPEEVADAILFFCSDAANYITGQVLSINGGSLTID